MTDKKDLQAGDKEVAEENGDASGGSDPEKSDAAGKGAAAGETKEKEASEDATKEEKKTASEEENTKQAESKTSNVTEEKAPDPNGAGIDPTEFGGPGAE